MHGTDLLDLGVSELDGVDDAIFVDFVGAGLDHHDAFGRADDHDVELAVVHLRVGRVADELVVHQSDADRADRALERNVGESERAGCAVDSGDIGIVIVISGENQGDDLCLAAEAFGEQRTDGAIDLAAGEDFALAGAAFALDEAAGDASAGVGVFAIVNREWEKIDADAGFGIGAGGSENNVVARSVQLRNHVPAWLVFQFQKRLFCRRRV